MNVLVISVLFFTAQAKFTANDVRATQEMKGSGATSKDVCEGRGSSCSVLLDVPAACAGATSACPVVIQLHGHGGRAAGSAMMGSPSVHKYNFIGVSPQGATYDVSGWNDGSMRNLKCKYDDYNCTKDPNDPLFVAGIVAALKELGSTGRFYIYGGSNGANEAQILAANACDELPFVGIGVHSGQLLATPSRSAGKPYDYNQPCAGSQPCTGGRKVAQISIHGDADPVIPYDGGSRFHSDVFSMMSEPNSNKLWAKQNGCTGSLSQSMVPASASGKTTTATHYVWGGCPAEGLVEYYKVAGAGHVATHSLDGTDVTETVFEFFAKIEKAHGHGPSPAPAPSPRPRPSPRPSPSPGPGPSPSPDVPVKCQQCFKTACADQQGKANTCRTCLQKNMKSCAQSCVPTPFKSVIEWFCKSEDEEGAIIV